jgi:hypothetical protein
MSHLVIIIVDDDKAREIQEWAGTHKRMLISGTVPAFKHWTVSTDAVTVTRILDARD